MTDLYYCYRVNNGDLLPKFVSVEKVKGEYRLAYCNGTDGRIKEPKAMDYYLSRPTKLELNYAIQEKLNSGHLVGITNTNDNPYGIHEGMVLRIANKQAHYYGDVYKITEFSDKAIVITTIKTLRNNDNPYIKDTAHATFLYYIQRDIENGTLEIVE